ncbi:MAG: hypothetical protein KBD78_03390 [Oligoflexales bacterium]|nr:hypothetical protein [Oligoflexales bacterium]
MRIFQAIVISVLASFLMASKCSKSEDKSEESSTTEMAPAGESMDAPASEAAPETTPEAAPETEAPETTE